MDENKYREEMSKVQMCEQKKAEIACAVKNSALRSKRRYGRSSYVVKRRHRIFFKSTAVLLSFAIVAFVVFTILYPGVIRPMRIDDPISKEDKEYMLGIVSGAQYIPDAEILAGANGGTASELPLNSQDEEVEIPIQAENPDSYFDLVMIEDTSKLEMSLDEYNELNDELANLGYCSYVKNYNIYDLKEQVEIAMSVIPGYDQWYQIDSYLKYNCYPFNKLHGWIYKVQHDKETGRIRLQILAGDYDGAYYDKTFGILYERSSFHKVRTYYDITYYTDEQGREVVDCVVYVYLNNGINYYPLFGERLINIRDTSLTKLAINYNTQYDLVNPVISNEGKSVTDTAFDSETFKNKKGTDHLLLQLNYSSSDDISLLKVEHSAGTIHTDNIEHTGVTYYKKDNDDIYCLSSRWCNIYTREDEIRNDLQSDRLYVDYNSYDVLADGAIKDAFVNTISLYVDSTCQGCLINKPSEDGVFIDCKHMPQDIDNSVKFYNAEITANDPNSPVVTDRSNAYPDIAASLESLTDKLHLQTKFTMGVYSTYTFENSINQYLYDLSEEYHAYLEDQDFYGLDMDPSIWFRSWVRADSASGVLLQNYNMLYNLSTDITHSGFDIRYDINGKFDGASIDPEKSYYAVLMMENIDDLDKFFVVDEVEIAQGEDFSLSGVMTPEDIAKIVFAEKDDSLREETFTLVLGVATKDAEGNYTIDGIYQDVLMGDKARYTVENTDMLNIVVDNRRHEYRILFSMLNEIQIFVNY